MSNCINQKMTKADLILVLRQKVQLVSQNGRFFDF